MINVALPVIVALSWVPTTQRPAPTPEKATEEAQVKADRAAQTETITCPVTGEKIPSCCCPVKK